MIIAGMFIVIAVVGAAETIITGTNELAQKNNVEDGQFSVFLPLTKEQEQAITDSGVMIERIFSADIDMGEAVLEKRYSEKHNISVGDSILAKNSAVEEYCYAYRLNEKLSHNELKELIKAEKDNSR